MLKQLTTVLIVLASGITSGQQRPDSRPETQVTVHNGRLAWAGLALGSTIGQVEATLGFVVALGPDVFDTGVCAGLESRTQIANTPVTLMFVRGGTNYTLQGIFVPFREEVELREVVAELKRRVPSLRYIPSIHDPALAEVNNAKPLYGLADDSLEQVLVGPKEGLWLTHGCND